MFEQIGVTGEGDAALDMRWLEWVVAGKPAILITKAPTKLVGILKEHNLLRSRLIVHCTITGWGETPMEPYVAATEYELKTYRALRSEMPGRVILRLDPVILFKDGLQRAYNVLRGAHTTREDRIKVSFVHNYEHINARLRTLGYPLLDEFDFSLENRMAAVKQLTETIPGKFEMCSEPGFVNVGCVSEEDCRILGVEPAKDLSSNPGHPGGCGCLANKFELLGNLHVCKHKCAYCFLK